MSRAETTDDDRYDRRLLERGELATLLARHEPILRRRVRLQLRRLELEDETDDVLQQVYLRLAREAARGLPPDMPPRVALHLYAKWAVGDWFKARNRDPQPLGDEVMHDHCAPASGPIDGKERLTVLALREAIAALPGRDGEIARAVLLEDRPIATVARELGCRRNAIDQAIHRVRRRLREEGLDGN